MTSRLPIITEGSRTVAALDGKREVIGKQIGVSGPYVSMLGRGAARPSIDLAYRIERILGIPMQAWARKPRATEAALTRNRSPECDAESRIDASKPTPPRAA